MGSVGAVRIVVGSDEPMSVTVAAIVAHLGELGHAVTVVAEGAEWPEVGRTVGESVTSGNADAGVCCCHTGTGVSMAANKVPGVRAALCGDAPTAAGARRWNDANVLAVGLRQTTPIVAAEMLDAFLSTDPDPSEAATIDRVEP